MAILDLGTTTQEFEGGYDAAIKHYIYGKSGGLVMDVTGFPDDYIYKAHGIINDGTADEPIYKPQPVDGSQHAKLVGVVMATMKKSKPSTGMMTQGTINNKATKYPFTANSLAVLKTLGIHNLED